MYFDFLCKIHFFIFKFLDGKSERLVPKYYGKNPTKQVKPVDSKAARNPQRVKKHLAKFVLKNIGKDLKIQQRMNG